MKKQLRSTRGFTLKTTRKGARRRSKPIPSGEFEARIDDLSDDGFGVARIDGKVCFINDALPGETVKFRYTHISKQLDQAQTTEVLEVSPDRAEPPCSHFGTCGGCTLQHMHPDAQLRHKEQQLVQTLKRVGQVEAQNIAPAIAGPHLGYRRRARLGVRYVAGLGRALVSFRERASSMLATIDRCEVLDPRVGNRLDVIGRMIASLSIRRVIPQIEMACAETVALVFRVLEAPSDADLKILHDFAEQEDFSIYLQSGGPETIRCIADQAPILDYSPDGGAARLQFQPNDFIQINEEVSQKAVRQALDWLQIRAGESVLELFSGLGNFSIPLIQAGADLTAVEGERSLVERARQNAVRLGLEARFHVSNLFEPTAGVSWLDRKYEAVLLDPPRAGAEAILETIANCEPTRVLYVSCHPATLARDAGILVNQFGYKLTRIGVMDMFSHTAHVESMALFERKDRART